MKEKAIFTSIVVSILFLVFSLFSSLNKNQKTPLADQSIDLNTPSDSKLKAYQNNYKKISVNDLKTQREAIDRFKRNRRRRARINRNTSASNTDINKRLKELQENAAIHKKNSKTKNTDKTKEKALTEEEKKKKEEAEKKKKQEAAKKEQQERIKNENQAKSSNSLNKKKDSNISSLKTKQRNQSSIIVANQNNSINEEPIEDDSSQENSNSTGTGSRQTSDETTDNTSLTESSTELDALIQERNTEGLLALLESSNLSTFKRTSLTTLVKSINIVENIDFISPIVISTYLNINNLGLFTNSMIVDDYSFEEKSFMASLIIQNLDGSAKLLSRSDFVDLYFNGVKAQLSNTTSESNSNVIDLYTELDMKIDETYELIDSETEVALNQ